MTPEPARHRLQLIHRREFLRHGIATDARHFHSGFLRQFRRDGAIDMRQAAEVEERSFPRDADRTAHEFELAQRGRSFSLSLGEGAEVRGKHASGNAL